MDITIRTVAEVSAVSGRAFAPGDSVWSCLYRTADGLLERIDALDSERAQLQVPGEVVCKWGQRIKEKAASEAEARRAALQTAEDVFISLYDDAPAGDGADDLAAARDRLKFFLGLQLERKRVLRPLGGRRFRHVPSGREFSVPDMEITPALVAAFQREIAAMGGAA